MTTFGYGDILPTNQVSQSLAFLEAVAGVLYMAVIVAIIISIYLSQVPQPLKRNKKQPTRFIYS